MKQLIFTARKKDFRVDTFRSGGKGGQHQNATDSGVRITHVETGITASSREFKSQHQNKKAAFNRVAKLLSDRVNGKVEQIKRRSAEIRVRSYNEHTNIVTDHGSGLKLPYDYVIKKLNLGEMIESRKLLTNN